MEVYPLSIPQIDWKIYTETYKQAFGKNPASAVDRAGLKLESPASFVSTLDFDDNTSVNDVLRKAAKTLLLEHSFCSFIFIGDLIALHPVPLRLVSVVHRDIDRMTSFAIMTGNIFQWRQAMWSASHYDDSETNVFFTYIKSFLNQAGFREALNYE